MTNFEFIEGSGPLLISVPHAGTLLAKGQRARMTPAAQELPDTDWFVDQLYHFYADYHCSILMARYSRYVVDLNRAANDAALYAGNSTGLFPTITFRSEPVYLPGVGVGPEEEAERIDQYWRPYHQQLAATLEAIHDQHGFAILLDAHSIVPECEFLFEGRLPDLNLGTNDGHSADSSLEDTAMAAIKRHPEYSSVSNGRFKGGYITRNYGSPENGRHALQLELSQATYMAPDDTSRVSVSAYKRLEPVLRDLVQSLSEWRPE